jgi:hypothetical protein
LARFVVACTPWQKNITSKPFLESVNYYCVWSLIHDGLINSLKEVDGKA